MHELLLYHRQEFQDSLKNFSNTGTLSRKGCPGILPGLFIDIAMIELDTLLYNPNLVIYFLQLFLVHTQDIQVRLFWKNPQKTGELVAGE